MDYVAQLSSFRSSQDFGQLPDSHQHHSKFAGLRAVAFATLLANPRFPNHFSEPDFGHHFCEPDFGHHFPNMTYEPMPSELDLRA